MKKSLRMRISMTKFFMLYILIFLPTGCATTMTPLTQAAKDGNVIMINKLLNEGAKVDEPNPGSSSAAPLIWSIMNCKIDAAKLLLSKGARVSNVADSYGWPPLFWALRCINIDRAFVERLIQNGADANAKDNYGATVLLNESGYVGDRIEIVQTLIDKGADVKVARHSDGLTPLMNASLANNFHNAQLLLERGADINARDKHGCTALIYASRYERPRAVKFLIERGADIHAFDNNNKNAILHAKGVFTDKAEIISLLQNAEHIRQEYLAKEKSIAKKVPSTKVQPVQEKQPATIAVDQKPPKEVVEGVDFGRYYALIIGNNHYMSLPKLLTATNDAQAIANILKQNYGFDIVLLQDANRSSILVELGKLRERLSRHDNLLIYYAGHGWLDKDGDEGYWLPVDATKDNDVNWISNSSITTHLRAMSAKHVLVVADSCYSGKLARGLHIQKKVSDYYSRVAQKRARSVISSGGLEPVIDSGGKGDHSVFASAFIDALQENRDIIDTMELFNMIRRPVVLNADQTPEYADIRKAGHDGGEFIFIRKK